MKYDLPIELAKRGYCQELYAKRLSVQKQPFSKSIPVLPHEPEKLFYNPYKGDFKPIKVDWEPTFSPTAHDAMYAFSRGSLPEYGKNLTMMQKIKNRILNLIETKQLKERGLNKIGFDKKEDPLYRNSIEKFNTIA